MTSGDRADTYYTRWSALYDQVARRTPGISTLREETVEQLDPPAGGIVVEMGCGPGPNFPFLRDASGHTGTVVGIDVARGAVQRADGRIRTNGWPNVHAIRGDASRSPLVAADAILATFVVGMFDDPARLVDDWCDVVGPGGRIGLLHFSRTGRWHAGLSNRALDLLVTISSPGTVRYRTGRSRRLDRRIRAGTDQLAERCEEVRTKRLWGGVIRLDTGTVSSA